MELLGNGCIGLCSSSRQSYYRLCGYGSENDPNKVCFALEIVRHLTSRLHNIQLFPDPCCLLFVLQNIVGYKNKIKCGWLSASMKWRHNKVCFALQIVRHLTSRLHNIQLFPDPCCLLFVLQNIVGYKNKIKCGWLSASMKWRHLGHLQLLSRAVALMTGMAEM